ncbi:red chlorophyll catabolite reductase, chloroplastic [Prosopis cineraria]|uniref:red chlorophyll catabolite reductase, chloroplastic n=1 Tax=Prosopis cineraria TaxID=364024 RepID=UPI00240ED6CF|nr:red chlorophyll catabolite reductase, chloroplastic [Prosopis cineraria]
MWCCHLSRSPFSVLSSSSSVRVLLSPPPPPPPSRTSVYTSSISCSAAAMAAHDEGRKKFLDFPFVSTSHKNLMLDLVSEVENRFNSQLLPCTLPPDVQYYQSQTGTAQGSLQIRSGQNNSPVDFVLGSWVHSELPTGGSLDITSLSGYLNLSNDSPNFVIELIRSSPTMLVLILDLPPRKDLVLWPDDLKTFYENTQLDKHRQAIEKIPEVKPYNSSSLYIRAASSPTAIMVSIGTRADDGGEERMEEIIRDHLDPISKEVLGIWLDHCACAKREVGGAERADLKKRDGIMRSKTIEIDLGSSFPRLFGPEVANRVLEAMRDYFT